ncbi:unnamed protein product [Effrenium voratum]|nr:unnamed protein product [Effrenium voratum]
MRLTLAPSFGARPAGCQVALRVSCRRAIASEADTWMHQLSTRFRSLTLIASATYLARSDFWRCASRPWTKDSRAAAQRLPHTLAQELLTAQQPTVAFVETRYVEEFTELIGTKATVPFVLVTAGSDAPMTRTWQTRLLRMPGLRACYATNLHTPLDAHKDVFHPLPVGFYSMRLNAQNEALLQGQFASDRDCRLLVPWMRMKNGQKMRRGYWNVLESEEYKDLVVLMKDRLAFPQYVEKLARHRFVLSPPGKGFDCTRTWEALAVGSMPLVAESKTFDPRIYDAARIRRIAGAAELSAETLAEILRGPAAVDQRQLKVDYWAARWRQHL